jgi:CheY-like chemotaxis protein
LVERPEDGPDTIRGVALVLVIEDNADLRDMYAEILAIGGHAARAVETADEALAAIASARPEVVVLDLGIAGGPDPVVEALRTGPLDEMGVPPKPPALILASGARDLAERAAALGAAHLQKPFAPEQLLQAVDRAVAKR